MNWKEIKEKYPKAWAKMLEWGMKNREIFRKNPEFIEAFISEFVRDLYDFFDGQGIYVDIITKKIDVGNIIFEYCIRIDHYKDSTGLLYTFGSLEMYKTRNEAEEGAFTKAFKIFESQL